jgi:hypothetical protein
MAFTAAQQKHFSLLNCMDGFSNFLYRCAADTHATIDTAGYFSSTAATTELVNFVRVGDIIDVIVFTDATFTVVSTYGRHIVLTNDGITINVSDVTVGTVTNTD